jgi:hypothetical protein
MRLWGKKMGKVMVDGFKHIDNGRHCESTSMRDLFAFYGRDYTESMIFGIDATMGFAFWEMGVEDDVWVEAWGGLLPYFIGGKSSSISENSLACRILGIIMKQETSDSADKAWDVSKELLNDNMPQIIKTDMYYLPYSETYEKFHFGGHTISLVGYDDDKNVAFVYDNDLINALEVPINLIKKARGSAECGRYMNPKNMWFTMSPRPDGKRPPLAAGLKLAIQQTVKNMLQSSMGSQGIGGIRRFGKSISKWKDTLSTTKMHSSPEGSASQAYLQFESMYGFIEEYGTGGSNFRNLFVEFLQEITHFAKEGPRAWSLEEIEIVENHIPIANRSAMLWSKFSGELKAAMDAGGNDCLDYINLEDLQEIILEIVELEENMFKAFSKIKL